MDLPTRYQEDAHLEGEDVEYIKRTLKHWRTQHDYDGPAWCGVELFHYNLAQAVQRVAIEAAGWYKYPSSTRSDKDGKDWRLIMPGDEELIAVNCHSLLHDEVWTLSTTIYSTDDIDPTNLSYIGHSDHWTRTLLWTREVAKVLATDGYDYTEPIQDLDNRLAWIPRLQQIADELKGELFAAVKQATGGLPQPVILSIGVSDVTVPVGSIASHTRLDEGYSVITVTKKALEDAELLREVIKHEMIHWILNGHTKQDHGRTFQMVSDMVGLPKEYQD